MIFRRCFRALTRGTIIFCCLNFGANIALPVAIADTDSPTQGWSPSVPPRTTDAPKTVSKKLKSKAKTDSTAAEKPDETTTEKASGNAERTRSAPGDSNIDSSSEVEGAEPSASSEKVGLAKQIVTPKDESANVKDALPLLKAVEAKYAKATSVEMSLSKVTQNKLLKKKKTATGKIVLKSHGLFRMDLDAPEKSSVILDGKKLWVVQYPQDPDFDNTTRVMVSSHPEKIQTPVLTTFLMGKGSLLDDFKIVKKSVAGSVTEIEMSPKRQSPDIKNLVVKLDQVKKEIIELTMKDNVDNYSEFSFDRIKFNGDVSDKIFEFKAPKGAEVNEM